MISKHGSMEACLCAYLCWNKSWGSFLVINKFKMKMHVH